MALSDWGWLALFKYRSWPCGEGYILIHRARVDHSAILPSQTRYPRDVNLVKSPWQLAALLLWRSSVFVHCRRLKAKEKIRKPLEVIGCLHLVFVASNIDYLKHGPENLQLRISPPLSPRRHHS